MSGQVELVSLQKKPHMYRYQCRHLQKFAKWSRVLEKTMIRTDLFFKQRMYVFPQHCQLLPHTGGFGSREFFYINITL